MAYDEELATRIRDIVQREPNWHERKMFGGLGFMVGGNMAVAAGSNGEMMVRCAPDQTPELVTSQGVDRMVMRGRSMDGWLNVTAPAISDEAALEKWVGVGVGYARSLPAK